MAIMAYSDGNGSMASLLRLVLLLCEPDEVRLLEHVVRFIDLPKAGVLDLLGEDLPGLYPNCEPSAPWARRR
jgi:hypothetical protein